jgi:hypothetical protein
MKMRTSFGRHRWSVALLGIAVALLSIAADCEKRPEADVTLVLDVRDGRCQAVKQFSNASEHDRLRLNFAVDNHCSATQWVAVSYTGPSPLSQCTASFPMLRWTEFPTGVSDAGSCEHPSGGCHQVLVLVEGGTVRPATPPTPVPKCKDILEDHSLEFQPYP